MAFSALSILTHGWHHPGEVDVVSAERPVITAVVEVKPKLRVESPQHVSSTVGVPTITGADPVVPRIVDTSSPQQQTGADEPTIVGAENLVPRITRAEEDE